MNQTEKDFIKLVLEDERFNDNTKKLVIESIFERHRDQLDDELKEYLYRQYAGAALQLGSAFMPAGSLGKAGIQVGEQLLKKSIGRKLSQEIGAGAAVGMGSGAVFGAGRGISENKNPILTAVTDALTGLFSGGALGAIGGNIQKKLNDKLLDTFKDKSSIKQFGKKNVINELKKYYSNYISGINGNHPEMGKYYFNNVGIRETIKQKFDKALEIADLITNIKKAKYLGPEPLKHTRKNDLIRQFHRLRYKNTDYIFSEDKYGNIKFHIARESDYNIKPKEPTEQNNSFGSDISIPKSERLTPVLRGPSDPDSTANNIITNNSANVKFEAHKS